MANDFPSHTSFFMDQSYLKLFWKKKQLLQVLTQILWKGILNKFPESASTVIFVIAIVYYFMICSIELVCITESHDNGPVFIKQKVSRKRGHKTIEEQKAAMRLAIGAGTRI